MQRTSRSNRSTLAAASLAAEAGLAFLSPVMAQPAWPTREVRLIAPFAAGSGGTDAVARLMTEKLREMWGQPVVMENIPGSSGTIGVTKLARSAPDGYTLVLSGAAAIVARAGRAAGSLAVCVGAIDARHLAPGDHGRIRNLR